MLVITRPKAGRLRLYTEGGTRRRIVTLLHVKKPAGDHAVGMNRSTQNRNEFVW
jgi:hypothetical protein